jgi:hypothetical protein
MVTAQMEEAGIPRLEVPPGNRMHSIYQFLLHPEEFRVRTAKITWVEVDYPKSDSWIFWFLALSTSSALVPGRYA